MTSPSYIDGVVQSAQRVTLGDELSADAAAGATSLVVDDAIDFDPDGGSLTINGQTIAYSAADDTASTITLAVGLSAGAFAGDRVDVTDANGIVLTELRAIVELPEPIDNDEALDVPVAHALVPLLPEGIRDPGTGESVRLTLQGSEWVLTDIVARPPQIDGSLIKAGSVVPAALSFTVGSTTATISAVAPTSPAVGDLWFDSGNGYELKSWDGAAWVSHQLGAAALAAGSVDATKVTFSARDLGGITTTIGAVAPTTPKTGDLWYDSTNGYRPNQWSGSAWVVVQFGTSAIQAGSVTASLIAGHTITAAQIAAGTITAVEIAANAITAAQIAAGTITGDRIAAGTITGSLIAAGTIVAGNIAAGTITADQLDVNALNAISVTAASIVAGSFSGSIGGDPSNPTSIIDAIIDGSLIYIDQDGGTLLAYTVPAVVATTVTITATGTWVVPAGVSSLKVECWGAGGGGGPGSAFSSAGGGGGGEYARNNAIAVTAGETLNVNIGAGGSGTSSTNGGATNVKRATTTLVQANGGKAPTTTTGKGTGGAGSTDPVHYSGGTGYSGSTTSATKGGGGGSSAGTGAAGVNATGQTGAVAPTGGGSGGAGGASGAAGLVGSIPGGGGGGSGYGGSPSGNGARGQITITYTPAASGPALYGSIASVAGTDSSTGTPVSYPAGFSVKGVDVADWNNANTAGFYSSAGNALNAPYSTTTTFTGYVFGRLNDTGLSQLVMRLTTGDQPELWMRTYSVANGWRPWHRVFDDTGVVTAAAISQTASAVLNNYSIRRVGNVCQMTCVVTVNSLGAGNIGNLQVATITDTRFQPAFQAICCSGNAGITMTGHIDSNGSVWIDSTTLGATTANYQVTLNSTYLV